MMCMMCDVCVCVFYCDMQDKALTIPLVTEG